MLEEHVVLVDENNNILGTAPKATVHRSSTPLHRAFSCFIFHKITGKLLLQQRSLKKIAWPGVWSNSCCGHPRINETNLEAAIRRIQEELGLTVQSLEEVAPYRYTFIKDGIMENEICPILVGWTNNEPNINPEEIEAIRWIDWSDFIKDIKTNPNDWSPWCIEEALILNKIKTNV
ncbi:MAG: isopentenyl-diphosphate Delta-isomerase [Candidatus Falkowbacteria bacterium]|nr:isopentenyl-diphosphate Delta-isomerase [Candidatus Falkowbacteria bacterium]